MIRQPATQFGKCSLQITDEIIGIQVHIVATRCQKAGNGKCVVGRLQIIRPTNGDHLRLRIDKQLDVFRVPQCVKRCFEYPQPAFPYVNGEYGILYSNTHRLLHLPYRDSEKAQLQLPIQQESAACFLRFPSPLQRTFHIH